MKAFNKLCLDRSSLPKLFLERVGRSEKQKRDSTTSSPVFFTHVIQRLMVSKFSKLHSITNFFLCGFWLDMVEGSRG